MVEFNEKIVTENIKRSMKFFGCEMTEENINAELNKAKNRFNDFNKGIDFRDKPKVTSIVEHTNEIGWNYRTYAKTYTYGNTSRKVYDLMRDYLSPDCGTNGTECISVYSAEDRDNLIKILQSMKF